MVKGLAKLRNRLHHGRTAKYVDASPFSSVKGGYSPMTGELYLGSIFSSIDVCYDLPTVAKDHALYLLF
jgi:hypothetical protein